MSKSNKKENSKENSSSIGKRLKELRTNVLHLSQKEMADALEVSQASVSYIEGSSRDVIPSGNFVQQLAKRFPDVNFNWLIHNHGRPTLKDEQIDEKKSERTFQKLNAEIERLKKDNSALLQLALKKKR